MAERESIFAEDWRESLRMHYMDVVRHNDKKTEETLVRVLHEVGFRDDELRELKLRATMRADDLHDDFVPELALEAEPPEQTVFPAVDVEPEPAPTEERYIAAELMDKSDTERAEDEPDESPNDDSPADDDPDLPQQMSLF